MAWTAPVLDDGTGTNGSVGSPWATITGLSGSPGALQRVSNAFAFGGYCASYRTDVTVAGADAESYVTASVGENIYFGAIINLQDPTGTPSFYVATRNTENGGEVRLVRYDDGTDTQLDVELWGTYGDGDDLGIRRVGDTLYVVTIEGGVETVRIEHTDTSPLSAGGSVGILGYEAGTVWRGVNFGGGELEAASVPVNSVAPAVTGDAIEGETLSCDDGSWTNTPTSYAKQWQRRAV